MQEELAGFDGLSAWGCEAYEFGAGQEVQLVRDAQDR
jgi:hypothetical protein